RNRGKDTSVFPRSWDVLCRSLERERFCSRRPRKRLWTVRGTDSVVAMSACESAYSAEEPQEPGKGFRSGSQGKVSGKTATEAARAVWTSVWKSRNTTVLRLCTRPEKPMFRFGAVRSFQSCPETGPGRQ